MEKCKSNNQHPCKGTKFQRKSLTHSEKIPTPFQTHKENHDQTRNARPINTI